MKCAKLLLVTQNASSVHDDSAVRLTTAPAEKIFSRMRAIATVGLGTFRVPLGEVEARDGDDELGRSGDSQNGVSCRDGCGKLAASDGDRRQEHDRDDVRKKAVDEADINLVRQFVSGAECSLRWASAMQKTDLGKPVASIRLEN